MGKRVLYERGSSQKPEPWRGGSDQYDLSGHPIKIRITRENAAWRHGGVNGHVALGFRNVDVTNYNRLKIRWSHSARSSRNQDRSFLGVHDDHRVITRHNAEGPSYNKHRVLLDAAIINRRTSFTDETQEVDISNLTDKKAIGFGAEISTGSTSGNEHVNIDVHEVWLESDDVDCEYTIRETECDATCDNPNGVYHRIIQIDQDREGNGEPCPEPIHDKQCIAEGCCDYIDDPDNIDNPWGECNRLCNTGTQKKRQILDPDKSDVNDPQCPAERFLERECNTQPCRWAGEADGELPPSHFGEPGSQTQTFVERGAPDPQYEGDSDGMDEDPDASPSSTSEPDDEDATDTNLWLYIGIAAAVVVIFMIIRARSTRL